jgi:hypothetical protein
MKFKYGDRVYVTRGFYVGLVGTLESVSDGSFGTDYFVKFDSGAAAFIRGSALALMVRCTKCAGELP